MSRSRSAAAATALTLLLLLGVGACADTRAHVDSLVDVDESPIPDPGPQAGRTFITEHQCVNAAVAAWDADHDGGWKQLLACAARSDFDDLGAIVRGPWGKELRSRREGPALVARVIARRGGDVDRDLRMCRRAGLPLYSLRAALASPDDVTGGLVVMRGSFGDARRAHGSRAVELNETRPMTDDDLMYDDDLVHRRMRATRLAMHELSIETGLTVVATAATVFEPATDYVVLLRFEGQHDAIVPGDPTSTKTAVGTVLASFESESTLMATR